MIANERPALARSLWAATGHPVPDRPALRGPAEADVAVIGAGFTGLSAALHLAEAGASVIVLEAETPGWGASGRNGGQVNPGLKLGPDAIEARFGPDLGGRMVALSGGAVDLVFDLIERHGIACDARRGGWIRAAHTPRALAALDTIGHEWRARGAAVETLDRRKTAAQLGTDAYAGGLIDRRGGNLHPLNYALGIAAAAERAGAIIHGDSRAHRIEETGTDVVVETAAGRVAARRAVVCTNAYTGDLARPLGRSVVAVTSIQVATAPLSDNVARSILPDGHTISDTRRLLLYFSKDAQGRFVMGGRGGTRDASILARQAALRHAAERLYPDLGGADWRHAWGGDVALTRDHLPGLFSLGPRIMAGLGYNGRGVAMATVMGRLLAEWALGRPDEALDFPVTRPRPIPFHRFRKLGLEAATGVASLLDRAGR